jgi:hypothetical protein
MQVTNKLDLEARETTIPHKDKNVVVFQGSTGVKVTDNEE